MRSHLPEKAERHFLGLVRESSIADYAGRGSQLTDEELRALFAVALAAMREAQRQAAPRETLRRQSSPALLDIPTPEPTVRRVARVRVAKDPSPPRSP